MKEEKEYIALDREFWEEFHQLGLKLKKAFEQQAKFNYIEAFDYIEEAYEHYNRIKKLMVDGKRVKIKLKEA